MQVMCNHCGVKNALGRIFCMSCGKKMTITNEDVAQAQAKNRPSWTRLVLAPLLWGAVAALAVAILWPAKPLPVTVRPVERPLVQSRMEGKLNALRSAATGGFLQRETFQAGEVEVYVWRRQGVTAGTNTPPLSVSVSGDQVRIRRIALFGPWTALGRSWGPFAFSRDAVLAANGKRLEPVSGRVGHLPLPWLTHLLVTGPVLSGIEWTPREKAIAEQAKRITVKDGELEIEVGP